MTNSITFLGRLFYAIFGALLGGIGAVGTCFWWNLDYSLMFIGGVAFAAATLAFALGEQAIYWLKGEARQAWW